MALDDRDYMRESSRRIMRDHYYSPKVYRRDRSEAPKRHCDWRWWVIAAAVAGALHHYGYTLSIIEAARRLVALLS